MSYRIVTWHGESRSLFYLLNEADEVVDTFYSRAEAYAALKFFGDELCASH